MVILKKKVKRIFADIKRVIKTVKMSAIFLILTAPMNPKNIILISFLIINKENGNESKS